MKIGVCRPSSRAAALRLALRSLHASQRGPLIESLGQLANEPLGAFDALVVGERGGRVVAATWVQPQPGKTGSLWAPESDSDLSVGDAERLVRHAAAIADQAGVSMLQLLAESSEPSHAAALRAAGFSDIATLDYLEWRTAQATPTPEPSASHELSIRVDGADDLPRLKRLVEETYVDTLDCPSLDGLRDVSDTLAGYRQIGEFDPTLWLRIERNGTDAGVLLLSRHPETKQLELVYMGVTPAARGHGIGRIAVREAQRLARQRGVERLVLAVDAANHPAKRLYREAGFSAWATRVVFVRPRRASPSPKR